MTLPSQYGLSDIFRFVAMSDPSEEPVLPRTGSNKAEHKKSDAHKKLEEATDLEAQRMIAQSLLAGDSGFGHLDAKHFQFAMDARRAPANVVP